MSRYCFASLFTWRNYAMKTSSAWEASVALQLHGLPELEKLDSTKQTKELTVSTVLNFNILFGN